jgi:hypothetical protein
MRQWLRSHLTYGNVMATIAVFLVLGGGSAVALSGSNTVFTDDIADDTLPAGGGNPAGGLVAADLRPGSVGTSEVAGNSLTGGDINESTLGPVPNAKSAGRAASVEGSCDPASASFTVCGSVTLTLPTSSRVMVVASGQWYSSTSGPTRGECRVLVDGPPGTGTVLGAAFPGETVDTSDSTHEKTVAVNGVTNALAAGSHTFELYCTQDEGNIAMDETFVSAASFSA